MWHATEAILWLGASKYVVHLRSNWRRVRPHLDRRFANPRTKNSCLTAVRQFLAWRVTEFYFA